MFTSRFVRIPAIPSPDAWSVIGVVSGIHAKFTSKCMRMLEKDPSISIFQHPMQELEASRHPFSNVICSAIHSRKYRVLILTSILREQLCYLYDIQKTKDNDVTRAVIRLGKPDTVSI
jgi:hypothetical protein